MKRYLLATVMAIALFGCANQEDRYVNNQPQNTDGINVQMQSPGMSYDGANSDGDSASGVLPPTFGKPSRIKLYVEKSKRIVC